MAQLTEEQKAKRQIELDMLAKMQEQFNGCPLFEGREKGSLDDLEGKEITIDQIYPLQDYHCVVFKEMPENFYLTGGALKDLCNDYEPQFVINRVIIIQPMVKTKARRDFRPIKIIR